MKSEVSSWDHEPHAALIYGRERGRLRRGNVNDQPA